MMPEMNSTVTAFEISVILTLKDVGVLYLQGEFALLHITIFKCKSAGNKDIDL